LVSSAGGLAIGAATGTLPAPIIGTAVGAVAGASCGLTIGLLTVALIAAVLSWRPALSSTSARVLFAVPTIVAVAVFATFSIVLLVSELRRPTGFSFDRLMILTFAVPVPLALTLVAGATPWCLESRVPELRRPRAGRHVWYAAIPIAVALVAAVPVWLLVFD
jgi:hypothetical protein